MTNGAIEALSMRSISVENFIRPRVNRTLRPPDRTSSNQSCDQPSQFKLAVDLGLPRDLTSRGLMGARIYGAFRNIISVEK